MQAVGDKILREKYGRTLKPTWLERNLVSDPSQRYLPETVVPIVFGYTNQTAYTTLEKCLTEQKSSWIDAVTQEFGNMLGKSSNRIIMTR